MKRFGIRLLVALATFIVGVGLTLFWLSRQMPRAVVTTLPVAQVRSVTLERKCDDINFATRADETPEEKAVRIAEEFVASNGYTDLPPDKNNLSYESIERADNVDEMLKVRHDTLERKAYGIRYCGKMGKPGWMVAFRFRKYYGIEFDEIGRVVTMDKDFKNLLVEHKSFPLGNVQKRFQ